MNQQNYYEHKLAYETDSRDQKVMLDAGENVIVVDARSPSDCCDDHPTSIGETADSASGCCGCC